MIQSCGDFLQKCLPDDYKIRFIGALFNFFICSTLYDIEKGIRCEKRSQKLWDFHVACARHINFARKVWKKIFFSVSSINQIQTSTFLAFLLCFLFKSLKMLHLYFKIPGIEWGYIWLLLYVDSYWYNSVDRDVDSTSILTTMTLMMMAILRMMTMKDNDDDDGDDNGDDSGCVKQYISTRNILGKLKLIAGSPNSL